MTPEQCRMGRAALRWSTTVLADAAGVNASTVNSFENGKDSYTSTATKLQEAMEATGKVSFEGDRCVCLVSQSSSNLQVQDTLKKLISIVEITPEIKRMWVFGSRHKGTHKPDSDLDIAVEIEWVKGRGLGINTNESALWSKVSERIEPLMKECCLWKLDLQWYGGEDETPLVHQYITDSSKLIYEKSD